MKKNKTLKISRKIKILGDEEIYNGQFIKVIKRHYITNNREKKVWEMIKRTGRHKIISVIGVTPKKEIILVKIYRIPIKSYVIETVMGITDRKGEKISKTAQREFLEETGYQSSKIVKLLKSPHNSGLSAWPVIFYAALDAKKAGKPKLESSEDIEVIKISSSKIIPFLMNNRKIDIKVLGLILILAQKGWIKI